MAYKIEITGLDLQDIRQDGLAEKIRVLISEDKKEDLNALIDHDKVIICSDEYLWSEATANNIKHVSPQKKAQLMRLLQK